MKLTSKNLKLRWINYAGYEIVLPNGKVIALDPCIDFEGKKYDFTREDYTGADYIILSHTHYDHTKDVGYLHKKFNSKVIVGAMSALSLAQYFDINPDNLYAVMPQEQYIFDDFVLDVFRSKHTFFNNKDLNINQILSNSKKPEHPFPQDHIDADVYGYIEYIDYMITTKENYRIFIAGGGPHKFTYRNIYETMRKFQPNLLFRQTSSKYTPEEFGQMAADFQCQLVFPLHQDGLARKSDITIDEYVNRANQELLRLGEQEKVVNPKQHVWYKIQTQVIEQ